MRPVNFQGLSKLANATAESANINRAFWIGDHAQI